MARGGGDQDIALLALIAIVAVVGIVGLFVSSSFEGGDSITGNVVASEGTEAGAVQT